MPLADKCRRATVVIDNSGALSATQAQVQTLQQRWYAHTALSNGVLALGAALTSLLLYAL